MLFDRKRNCVLQTYGNSVLKAKSAPVTLFDAALTELADLMIGAMHKLDGIGLAAVQVGILKRIIVLDIAPESIGNPPTPGELLLLGQMPLALVNPEIIDSGSETESYDEGCLSVPAIYAPVVRPRQIRLKAQRLDGSELEIECGGLLARCIQHEVDHLDGVLFVDRLAPPAAIRISAALEGLKRRGKKRKFTKEVKF